MYVGIDMKMNMKFTFIVEEIFDENAKGYVSKRDSATNSISLSTYNFLQFLHKGR